MNKSSPQQRGSLVSRYALAPDVIEATSLAIVDESLGDRFSAPDDRFVATRVLYAAGDLGLAGNLRISPDAVVAGLEALRLQAPIVTDVRMVMSGVNGRLADSLRVERVCAIDSPTVAEQARANNLPRAVEAIRALRDRLDGAVAVIGNAPTALLALLDLVDAGVRPAVIIGMPVGFVAAAEAKDELMRRTVPYLTLTGSRGGSPLAAAATNALMLLADPKPEIRDRTQTAVLFAGHGSRARDAAEAMLAAVAHVRDQGTFPIVETGYLEMTQPDIPEALRRCVEQGAKRVLVVPYFLHLGLHIQRDIPAVLRREAERYPGVSVSMGRPIGLHADLANVMVAGALETEALVDIRETPEFAGTPRGAPVADNDGG